MNELSLFTGIGGGLLGTKLLGWRCIGAVEIDAYCCQVLQQRIEDGCFEPFPIWNIDIREFNAKYAELYTGLVDVITAGFPCQPFSVAGKGKAEQDDRNMWPETKRTIAIVRPAFVFLENVPGLLAKDYAITIFNDLAEIGYGVLCPLKLGADNVGANHRRKRVWILAYANGAGQSTDSRARQSGKSSETGDYTRGRGSNVAYTEGIAERPGLCQDEPAGIGRGRSGNGNCTKSEWWAVEPDVGRLAYGVPNRVDRLKAAGNAQVPAVVAEAWRLLTDDND